jgi:hypothetical protein
MSPQGLTIQVMGVSPSGWHDRFQLPLNSSEQSGWGMIKGCQGASDPLEMASFPPLFLLPRPPRGASQQVSWLLLLQWPPFIRCLNGSLSSRMAFSTGLAQRRNRSPLENGLGCFKKPIHSIIQQWKAHKKQIKRYCRTNH